MSFKAFLDRVISMIIGSKLKTKFIIGLTIILLIIPIMGISFLYSLGGLININTDMEKSLNNKEHLKSRVKFQQTMIPKFEKMISEFMINEELIKEYKDNMLTDNSFKELTYIEANQFENIEKVKERLEGFDSEGATDVLMIKIKPSVEEFAKKVNEIINKIELDIKDMAALQTKLTI